MNNKNVFTKTMLPLYLCVSQSGHIGSTNFECHEQSFLINIVTLSLFSRSRHNAMTQWKSDTSLLTKFLATFLNVFDNISQGMSWWE